MIRRLTLAFALLTASAAQAANPLTHYEAEDRTGGACPPVLILSHGLGGDELGLGDLARAARDAGFDTWVMGHPESGRPLLRGVLTAPDRRAALAAAVGDVPVNQARRADLDAAITAATEDCRPPLMVFGGHSMGAQTVMVEAGAKNALGVEGADRFDAYVALSAPGVGGRFPDEHAWTAIDKPMLVVTGTQDKAVEGEWSTRLHAFEDLPADGRKVLAVVEGATHMEVSGSVGGPRAELVREVVLDFLATLLGRGEGIRERTGVTLSFK